ncbi:MAG: hypothetical protein ACLFTH_03390 [Candidatus Woesearchaeota archaeon]
MTPCTLSSLADWLEKNPDTFIVTDVKEANIAALKLISEMIPDHENRIIPEVHDPENYAMIKEMGFNHVLFATYAYSGSDDDVLSAIGEFDGSFAVALPEDKVPSDLSNRLVKKGIPVYVHTINSVKDMKRLKEEHQITGIYTDVLVP